MTKLMYNTPSRVITNEHFSQPRNKMKNQAEREEWRRLIWALADGEISEEDKERLEDVLRNESEARKLYVRNMAMESLLQWENSPAEMVEEGSVKTAGPVVIFSRWFGGFARMPIAAAVALGVGLASYFALRSVEDGPVLADTTTSEDEATVIPENANPLVAALGEMPAITEIEEVAGLTITTERTAQGALVQRVYFPVPEEVPVRPSVERPLEEGVVGFDENDLLVKASYPIEILESEQGFAAEGRVETHGEIGVWDGKDVLLTLTEHGVRPDKGTDMMKFSTPVAVSGDVAEATEILQVIDVRAFGKQIDAHKVTARTSVRFNQSIDFDGTAYALRLHAINREEGENRAIGREVAQVAADHDTESWQPAESEINLPAGTDYLVLSVSVRKEGDPQTILANIGGGSYADAVNLSMEVDGQQVYGTL